MADNITTIKDPTVYVKPGDPLVNYLKENVNGLSKNNKKKVPENICKLIKTKKVNNLDCSDLDWINRYLIDRRRNDDDDNGEVEDLLTGKELDDVLVSLSAEKFASLDAVELLKEKNKNLPYLHEIMRGSELILPENEVIERNPVLAERVEKLKKEQEEREYQAMTKNISSTSRRHHPEDSISYQMNMMNRHLIAVGSLLISVGAGFAFGFLGLELIIGGIHFAIRLILGISCALIIGLAEFYFLAKSLNEEEKREEDKGKPEKSAVQKSKKKGSKVKVHKD